MKQSMFTVLDNRPLTAEIYRMVLSGDTGAFTAPGQFVNVRIDPLYLRRPISVCDLEGDRLTLIYKVVGKGTSLLAEKDPGEKLDLLTGLGNGYDLNRPAGKVLVLGGGVGIPPMYLLTKELLRRGFQPAVRLGFNSAADAFYCDEFRGLTQDTEIYTVDGSLGIRGYVTAALEDASADYFFACGPLPMLKAVYHASRCGGQLSLEERMGCGFGACMGCSVQTAAGPRRVCKDGPVFRKEELLWND